MFEKYLEEIGLSDKEAAVYIALLQTEHDSVANIAEKAKIKRTTVYPTLESLAKKGLVSEVILEKKTHYKAEPPERLETYTDRRKIELDENSRRLKDIVPQLKSIQREGGERPVVTFFEGLDGIFNATSQSIESLEKQAGKEMYIIYPRDLTDKLYTPEIRAKYSNLRRDKKIHNKVIYTYSEGDLPVNNSTTRIRLDSNLYPITCEITVFNDSVLINTLSKSLSSISIKSVDLAITLKSLINYIHDNPKK